MTLSFGKTCRLKSILISLRRFRKDKSAARSVHFSGKCLLFGCRKTDKTEKCAIFGDLAGNTVHVPEGQPPIGRRIKNDDFTGVSLPVISMAGQTKKGDATDEERNSKVSPADRTADICASGNWLPDPIQLYPHVWHRHRV